MASFRFSRRRARVRAMCRIGMWCGAGILSVAGLAGAGSPVADATMNREADTLRSLLDRKADVNAPQVDGTTALHWAANWDDLATADLLIRAGANAGAANRDQATPLFVASVNGSAA